MSFQVDIRNFSGFSKCKKRFLSKLPKNYTSLEMENKCWKWQGYISKKHHYGEFDWGYKDKYLAHRMSYIIFNGIIPYNQIVMHTCDNPCCVNPKHLVLGNSRENSIDMVKRNRQGRQKLNEECVKVIKWMLKYQPKRGLAAKLARVYNINPKIISSINTGKSWSYIQIN